MAMMTKEEMIKKLGIEELKPEAQTQLLQDIANTVSTRILNGIYDKLTDEDIDELERLTDTSDEGSVEWFIKSKFEHYDEFAIQTENDVINELAESMKLLPKSQ